MKILHYLLGLPPVRGGGLVKYALDLAETQSQEDEILLLLPGPISRKKETRDKILIKHKGYWKGIPQYRIYNPLPIPMGNGILDIEEFTVTCDGQIYRDFLEDMKPDVIHVHTLMGLHKEFLAEAKKLSIPVVYTTHDYFGICPIANLLYKGSSCDCPGSHCGECSQYAFAEKRLLLEQSTAYKMYRNSDWLIRLLRTDALKSAAKNIRSRSPEKAAKEEESAQEQHTTQQPNQTERETLPTEKEYAVLLKYYQEMFALVTCFHFNSNISRQIYEQHLGQLHGEVISISNKNIRDRRTLHESKGKLKVGFVGGDVAFKGLNRLQKVIEEIYNSGKKQIELQVYGSLEKEEYPFCKYYDAYTDENRDMVFRKMDILAVPSSWMETFGLVVLEALSYGLPVLVTDKVGAKLLLEDSERPLGIVLPDDDKAWKECLEDLHDHLEKIAIYSGNICKSDVELDYNSHVMNIRQLYQNACEQ